MTVSASPAGRRQKFVILTQLFLLGLLPILIVLSHRNIVAQIVLMAAAIAAYPGVWPAVGRAFSRRAVAGGGAPAILAALLLFCLYTLLSALWSPAPERWDQGGKLLLFVIAAAALVWLAKRCGPDDRRQMTTLFTLAVWLSVLLLAFEAITGGWIRDLVPPDGPPGRDWISLGRGAEIALYLAVPVVLAWRVAGSGSGSGSGSGNGGGWIGRHSLVATGSLLAALGIACLILNISANVLALAAGAVAGLAAWLRPKLVVRLIGVGYLACLFGMPVLALLLPESAAMAEISSIPASWVLRLVAWRAGADEIFSGILPFLFGGGIGYSSYLTDSLGMIQLAGLRYEVPVMPWHPHNLFLQVWLEFGLAGALIFGAVIAITLRFVSGIALTSPLAAGICALAAIFLVFLMIETNLWSLWRLAAPVLGLFALVLVTRKIS